MVARHAMWFGCGALSMRRRLSRGACRGSLLRRTAFGCAPSPRRCVTARARCRVVFEARSLGPAIDFDPRCVGTRETGVRHVQLAHDLRSHHRRHPPTGRLEFAELRTDIQGGLPESRRSCTSVYGRLPNSGATSLLNSRRRRTSLPKSARLRNGSRAERSFRPMRGGLFEFAIFGVEYLDSEHKVLLAEGASTAQAIALVGSGGAPVRHRKFFGSEGCGNEVLRCRNEGRLTLCHRSQITRKA